MTIAIILLIIIYIFNIIDYCQTIYAIQHFGIGIEANPIARFWFKHNCAGEIKLIGMAIILIIFGFIIKYDKKQIWVIYFLVIFYLFVITRNFMILIKLGILL